MRHTIETALVENFRDTLNADASTRRVEGPVIYIEGDDTRPEAIAEQAWAIGNRMGRDADGSAWPANCRSMSEGDVVAIHIDGRAEAVFLQAMMFGFERVDREQVLANTILRSEMLTDYGPWADASAEVKPGVTEFEAVR